MARLLLFLLLFSIYSVYGNRYQTYNGYGKGYGNGNGNGYGKDYGDHDKGYGDYGPYASGYKPTAKTYGFKVPPAFLKSNPYSYLFSKSSSTKDYDSPSETSLLSSAYTSKSMPSGKYSGKSYRTYGKRPSSYPYNREEPEGKPHRDTDDYGKHPYRKSYFNRLEARPERRLEPRTERRQEPRPEDRLEDRPEPSYTKTNSRGKTSHYSKSPYDDAAPGRASYFPRSHFSDFGREQGEKAKMLRGMKKIYGQSAPRKTVFFRQGDRTFRSRDPCVNLPEGEYVLDGRFDALFSYVDPQCYFVKCANKKAYLNQCSRASRNTGSGEGFCSHLDLEGFCGVSFHDAHKTRT